MHQKTLKHEICCQGTGLHTGTNVRMCLKPAPPDFGIRFRRLDLAERPMIAARHEEVVQTARATTLGKNGTAIHTVEHLMAAFMGKGVDNALVELDGPEVPIFDGSAAPYLALLDEAQLKEQKLPRKYIKVTRSFMIEQGGSFVKVHPADHLQITYTIDFAHPLVGLQTSRWTFDGSSFAREIAGARTFGFLKDLEGLQDEGFARGGSLANAIVFDDDGVLNQEGFRYADECVRHKILDLLGDIALAGLPIVGHFEAFKAGHTLHHQFLRMLLAKPEFYRVTTATPAESQFFQIRHAEASVRPILQTASTG